MKTLGQFRLAVQQGNWGYFGSLELEVEMLSSGSGIETVIPAEMAQWSSGIRFGISYAYERCGSPPIALRASVVRAEGHPVDTTELVMAYVSAHALWDALKETPDRRPHLNTAEGIFTFPK